MVAAVAGRHRRLRRPSRFPRDSAPRIAVIVVTGAARRSYRTVGDSATQTALLVATSAAGGALVLLENPPPAVDASVPLRLSCDRSAARFL